MTTRFERRQRQIEREALSRLDDDMRTLVGGVARIVVRYATGRSEGGDVIVPNLRRTRDAIKRNVWSEVIKPYFIGQGEEPLVDDRPQSPFMQLIVDGIEAGIRNAAEEQVRLIRRYTPDDVAAWLMGPRPIGADVELREIISKNYNPHPKSLPINGEGLSDAFVLQEQGGRRYDPFHYFVDERGYTLSEKGWQSALETRRAIDALLDQEIARGTSAVRMAQLLETYLIPSARGIQTRTPYGQVGSFWARRLARTEITAAAGRATVNMALANPLVEFIEWVLSASHPRIDICDDLAKTYPKDSVPPYPPHPHCLCTLIARVVRERAAVIADIREAMREPEHDLAPLQGAFAVDWLVAALMSGAFAVLVRRLHGENQA